MASSTNLQFYIVENGDCQYISVHEQAVWDSTDLPITRAEVALAMYWFSSVNLADRGSDLTNTGTEANRAVYDIEVTTRGLYQVYLFAVLKWVAGTTVVDDGIVYYNSNFWINVSGGSLGTAPALDGNWEVLTDSEADRLRFLAFTETSEVSPDFEGAYYTSVYNFNCINKRLYKIACNKWRVINIEGNTDRTVLVKVWNLAKTEVINSYYIEIEDESDGPLLEEEYVDIEMDEDNVYLVEVGIAELDEEGVVTGDFDEAFRTSEDIVYVLCDIEACWVSMSKNLLCKDVSECCSSCDSDTQDTIDKSRYALNMINALWFNVMAYIEIEQGLYKGLYSVYEINGNNYLNTTSPERIEYAKNVEDSITKIKEIIARCGDCGILDSSDDCLTC